MSTDFSTIKIQQFGKITEICITDDEVKCGKRNIGGPGSTGQTTTGQTCPKLNTNTNSLVIEEECNNNFGHINVVNRCGFELPPYKRAEPLELKYEQTNKGPIYGGSEVDVDYQTKEIYDELNIKHDLVDANMQSIVPANEFLKITRVGFKKISPPLSTSEPSLSMALYKTNLDQGLGGWDVTKYLYKQLCQVMAYNYHFPNGAFRIYLDHYMLELFKKLKPDELKLAIDQNISQYELGKNQKVNMLDLFNRFKQYVDDNEKKYTFTNAYEKFIFYYVSASKIYNTTDSDDQIDNNKAGDFFVHKFSGDFVEIVNGVERHITDGNIGQIVRFICLKQTDYKYNNQIIKRNKHYVWRDAHTNQIGHNDAELIRAFNTSVKKSNRKKYNLLPVNLRYKMGWHLIQQCPADVDRYYIISAIAGVIQMANFTDEPEWLKKDEYIHTVGMAFLIDINDNVALKFHRPPQINYNNKNAIVKEYGYGIEEHLFDRFFNEQFKDYNVYFKFNFLWDVVDNRFFTTAVNYYNSGNSSNVIFDCFTILLIFLYRTNKLNVTFSFFEFIEQVELLRNNPPSDPILKKILGFILSIYPTKYFIQATIFNQYTEYVGISDTDMSKLIEFPDHFKYGREELQKPLMKHPLYPTNYAKLKDSERKYNTKDIVDKYLMEKAIFVKDLKNYTVADLSSLNFKCHVPIQQSGLEWCVNPYLESIQNCPNDQFFSGFYADTPEALKYGVYRNPKELENLIQTVDSTAQLALYKNISVPSVSKVYRGGNNDAQYREKYLKYKAKYLQLKNTLY
jgi:hypothetical protein